MPQEASLSSCLPIHFSAPSPFVQFFFSISISPLTPPRTLLISVMCCSFVVVVQSLDHVQLFCDPMNCRPPGSVHGISQARILQWVAISFSSESSSPRDRSHICCISGEFFTNEPVQFQSYSHSFTHLQHLFSMMFTVFIYGSFMFHSSYNNIKVFLQVLLQHYPNFLLLPPSREITLSSSSTSSPAHQTSMFVVLLLLSSNGNCVLSQEPVAP